MREGLRTNFEGNPRNILEITGRNFDAVKKVLLVDESAIPRDAQVLVVGEGFSDFSLELQRKREDLNIIAMDQVYAYAHPSDEPEVIEKKLQNAGFDTDMVLSRMDYEKTKPKETEKLPGYVAGDVYQIPLAENSVDVIYLSHVLEHIDFGKAIPGLLRTLKDGGEIRFGGVFFTKQSDEDKIYLGKTRRDTYDGMVLDGPDKPSLIEGMKFLREQGEQVRVYVYKGVMSSRYGDICETLIIKKGDDVPEFDVEEGGKKGKILKLKLATLDDTKSNFPKVDFEEVENTSA